MKVLECSSRGVKQFSAFYAYIDVFGWSKSIEEHYQGCKYSWTDGVMHPSGKGNKVDLLLIGENNLEPKYLTPFYKLLWVKYLDTYPNLVKYASRFDEFSDMFRGKSINCQADVIRDYVKHGRGYIMKDDMVQELISILKK